MKEHSGVRGLPPRGAAMCMERWMTPRKVVTFVECRGCDYRGIKTEKNRGEGFYRRHNCVTYDVKAVRRHGIGGTKKQRVEEQRE